jgi:hypothetical protein
MLKIVDFIYAVNAGSLSSYIEYNQVESYGGEERNIVLQSSVISQEKKLIIQDLFNHLSEDCRWLIQTIYNAPYEISTPKTRRLSKSSIIRSLERKRKWKKRKIIRICNETICFLKEIDSI